MNPVITDQQRPISRCDQLPNTCGGPILEAVASYRGTIVDLDRQQAVDAAQLHEAIDRVAQALTRRGLVGGDRVVFSVGNGPQFVAALCGVLAAEGSPLVLHGDTPAEELRRYAHAFSARFVLSEDVRPEALQNLGTCVERWPLAPWLEMTVADVALGPHAADFPVLPGVPLHPTSGTTGRPKVAIRPALRAEAEARHYIDAMAITPEDTILCVVPQSHGYGYGMGFMVPMLSSARLCTTRQFNPRCLQRAICQHGVTIFPAVPAMLDLALRAPGGGGASRLRLVLAAGAPLAASTAAEYRRQTGMKVTPLYGTTETGGISVAVAEGDDRPAPCVGPPMRGVEAEVVPIDDVPELAEGVGRLRIRSSSMMTGYLTPDGVDSTLLPDGWFTSGDLARIDDAGRIHLVGREKEIINVFGMKVVPSEVEEVIATVPRVREVKVYAGQHRSGSEIVKAAVAGDAGLEVATIRAHCEAHLAPYKRPHVVHLVDALPRSPLGKILRDQLP